MPIVKKIHNYPKPTLTLSRTASFEEDLSFLNLKSEGTEKTNCPVKDRARCCSIGFGGKNDSPPAFDKPSISLNITRKVKNSPLLSIQKFIHSHIIYQALDRILTPESLWCKYQLDPAHSLIIKEHELTNHRFQKIAKSILDTLKNYQVTVQPQISQFSNSQSLRTILNKNESLTL